MREKTKAILYIILAGVGFSFMNVFVRLSGDLPTIEKAFFRNLVAAFIALVVLIRSDLGLHYEKRHIPMLFMRSICGTLGIMCNFYAVDHMNIADASILNKLSPFAAVKGKCKSETICCSDRCIHRCFICYQTIPELH